MTNFFRFPHTPHLAWLGPDSPRDDKVLSTAEVERLLDSDVAVEEKLDGANIGFSLSPEGELLAQNRGHYISTPYVGQFVRLQEWLSLHGEAIQNSLFEHFDDGLILFGEWCAARHSLDYKSLPDWFLLFDVYERRFGKFWSSKRREALAKHIGLATVPQLYYGRCTLGQLRRMLSDEASRYRSGPMEGIVVRRESALHCEARAKLVRADFTQTIAEHWRQRRIEWNRLA
jgi:ATP-dependent RNA circularization protein (DNA/RNA ligase family)